jgi:hypothetical protein
MSNKHFTEQDKQNVVKFLNYVAKHATFEMKTNDVIEYFKLLSAMQQNILPKIEANVMEIVKVHEQDKAKD